MDLLSSTFHQAAQEELNACLWSPSEPLEFQLDPSSAGVPYFVGPNNANNNSENHSESNHSQHHQSSHPGAFVFSSPGAPSLLTSPGPYNPTPIIPAIGGLPGQQHPSLLLTRKQSHDVMAMALPTPTTPLDLSGQLDALVKSNPHQSQQQQSLSIITSGLPSGAPPLNAPIPLSAPVMGRPMPIEFMGFPPSGESVPSSHLGSQSFHVLTSPQTAHPFFATPSTGDFFHYMNHQHRNDTSSPSTSLPSPPSTASATSSGSSQFPSPGSSLDEQQQPLQPSLHMSHQQYNQRMFSPVSPMTAFMSHPTANAGNPGSFSFGPGHNHHASISAGSGSSSDSLVLEHWAPVGSSEFRTPSITFSDQHNAKKGRKRARSIVASDSNEDGSESSASKKAAKSFPCTHEGCTYVFTKFQNLKSHLRMHTTTEKSFACELCSLAFRRKHDLSRHYRSLHAPVKSYECTLCKKAYARSDALKRHLASRAHIENAAAHMNSVAEGSIVEGTVVVSSPRAMDDHEYDHEFSEINKSGLPTAPPSPLETLGMSQTMQAYPNGFHPDFPMPVPAPPPPIMVQQETSFSLASLASPVLQSPLPKELLLRSPLLGSDDPQGMGKRRRTVSEPKLVPKKLVHVAGTNPSMPSISEDLSFS